MSITTHTKWNHKFDIEKILILNNEGKNIRQIADILEIPERRFGELEIRLQKEFGRIEGKISNIYKWMFVCWITQILAVLGFLKYFIR